jgi:threonine dehydratase
MPVYRYVEYISLVEEDDIAKGIYLMLEKHNKVIEGSAGCSVAALFKVRAIYILELY